MDAGGRFSTRSSHSSDQFNLYGQARERTHYQRANAFISNAFSFLGRDNHNAYKYYDEDHGQNPIMAQQQNPQQQPYPQQAYPQQPYPQQQFPQQPYPKRLSESEPGTPHQPKSTSGPSCSGVTCGLIAVIVLLVLAIVGIILGVVFGLVLKTPGHKFTSTVDTQQPWDSALSNKSSEEYQNMTEKMRDALNKAFELSQLSAYSKPKQEILGFKQSTSSGRRKKRADATAVCDVVTSFSSKTTPSVEKFMSDVNGAFTKLKEDSAIDFHPAILTVLDSGSNGGTASAATTTTTAAPTTLVSLTPPSRTTPKPVTCTAAATADVNQQCAVFSGNVGFPNLFGHKSVSDTIEAYVILKALADTDCMAEAEKFVCTLLYTPCVNSILRPPCKKFCTDFVKNCKYPLNCDPLPDSDNPDFCVASAAQLAETENVPPYDFTCPSGEEICGIEPNCFATSKKCDGTQDCPDGQDELNCNSLVTFTCDFEANLCALTNDADSHYQWTRKTGPSPSPFTGPFIDHTKKNNAGGYMLAEASGRYFLDQSTIWTPSQNIQAVSCLQFYYHMRGIDVHKLEVLLQTDKVTIPWFQNGDRGDFWLLGRVPLPAGQVKVGFRATMTGSYHGDIGVDDITIKKEACKAWNCETDEKRVNLFSCSNTNCILDTLRCNGVDDCGNYNDERSCVCASSQFKCGIGMCIASRKRCDGVIDCPDRGDEIGCKCPLGQVQCADNSTCILREWQCDREVDCPGGEDEQSCRTCAAAQWQCRDFGCINRNNRCDGTAQCADKSDEENCVQLTPQGTVMVTSQADSYPLCYTSYSDSMGDKICSELGLKKRVSAAKVVKTGEQYVHVTSATGSIVSNTVVNTSCDSNEVVKLTCESKDCGKSFLNSASVTYVINGKDAAGGRWPWQVAVLKNGLLTCGGVIINSRQILTAAHCIDAIGSARIYKIMAGSSKLLGIDATRVYKQVKTITAHANFNLAFWFRGNDIAVLNLEGYLTFNNYIQPICLPESTDVFYSTSTCYSAGWGLTDSRAQAPSNDLKEAKLKIVSQEKCQKAFPNIGTGPGVFCAGYDSGSVANCAGDSGGPLMCLGSDKRWKLAGIYVIYATGCNVPDRSSVFTDVVHYRGWLNTLIVCEFQCTNNQCVFTRDLCDGVDDCGDNSDEEAVCAKAENQGTSCTFENSYNCGYKSYGKGNYVSLERKKGPVADNMGPSADKTKGSSGYYIYAKTGPGIFMGPPYKNEAAQCISFYYLMRGTSTTLQVIRHPLASGTSIDDLTINDNDKTAVNTITTTGATGTWQFVKVDLPATASGVDNEVLGFEFTGSNPNIAIDDVKLLGSACSAVACQTKEFQCTDKADCLPESSKCNFVKNCADGSDETVANCPAASEADRGYFCDFEDLNICGIKQQNDEPSDWKLVAPADSLTTTGLHAVSGPSAHYFYTDTSATTDNDALSAAFSIDVELRAVTDQTKLCMEFRYAAETTGFLEITTTDSNNVEKSEVIYNSHVLSWTTRRLQLTYDIKKVTFKAHTTASVAPDAQAFDFIAIDDIVITHGQCACKPDEQFCADGVHCFPKDKLCVREFICPDGSDNPLNCSCDADSDQFQCTNGNCIPKSQQCNTNDDCGDDSDERNCTRCDSGGNDNFLCSDGYCLKKSFKCDGAKDCSNDEEGCCQNAEFQCATSPASCILATKQCDGNSDCSDGSDELRCAQIAKFTTVENVVQIRVGEQWFPVCSDGWNNLLSPSVCTLLDLGSSTSTSSSAALAAGQSYYSYTGIETTFKPHLFTPAATCTSNKAVVVICSDTVPCGFRDPGGSSPVAFIVGGTAVTEGTWPWLGYLTHAGDYTCSGSLISDQWYLTAAHCLSNTSPSLHKVVFGSTKLSASSQSIVNSDVEKIIKHPNYETNEPGQGFFTINDIALIKLKNKVAFSLNVNRLCLPAADDTFTVTDQCYVSGWGYSNTAVGEPTEDLRQLRMSLVTDENCKQADSTEIIHDKTNQLCAGYQETVSGYKPSSCRGDSGGPLMCRKSGIWKSVGLVSWGLADCDVEQPTVFTKVSAYKSWIETTISDNTPTSS